jgi:hypothetical protein
MVFITMWVRGKRNKSFLIKYRLVKHYESVHERKNSNVKFVTKSFSLNSDLKKHVASVHEGIKPFKCRVCDYTMWLIILLSSN